MWSVAVHGGAGNISRDLEPTLRLQYAFALPRLVPRLYASQHSYCAPVHINIINARIATAVHSILTQCAAKLEQGACALDVSQYAVVQVKPSF